MISKREHDFMAADLANVEGLLSDLTDSDFVARWSLESRRDEIRAALAAVETKEQPLASTVVLFAGQPVVGSKGIQSEFGANAIVRFQDIVSKVFAARANRTLAPVGPVFGKDKSRLYVTNIVHGSFGFQFEELEDPTNTTPMFDSELKESVDETVHLMAAFDEADDAQFGAAVENIDARILVTIRRFFTLVQKSNATFRVISGNFEKQYGHEALERAIERAKLTTITEQEQWYEGQLEGVLPNNRDFEFRTTNQEVLRGKIDRSLSQEHVATLNGEWLTKNSKALVRIRQILRQGWVSHKALFLLQVSEISEVSIS